MQLRRAFEPVDMATPSLEVVDAETEPTLIRARETAQAADSEIGTLRKNNSRASAWLEHLDQTHRAACDHRRSQDIDEQCQNHLESQRAAAVAADKALLEATPAVESSRAEANANHELYRSSIAQHAMRAAPEQPRWRLTIAKSPLMGLQENRKCLAELREHIKRARAVGDNVSDGLLQCMYDLQYKNEKHTNKGITTE